MRAGSGSRRGCRSPCVSMIFPVDAEGKAIPYGVYDMARNEAWVSVGPRPQTTDTPSSSRQSVDRPAAFLVDVAPALSFDLGSGGQSGYSSDRLQFP